MNSMQQSHSAWTADFGESPLSPASPSSSITSDPWGVSASTTSSTPPLMQSTASVPDPFLSISSTSTPAVSALSQLMGQQQYQTLPVVPARPSPSTGNNLNTQRNVPNSGPFVNSVFPNQTMSQSLPPTYANPMMENPFMTPTTPYPSPANAQAFMQPNSGFSANNSVSLFDIDPFTSSVFDRPVPQPTTNSADTKLSSSVSGGSRDVFSTELFGELAPALGGPRGKITREAFPEATRVPKPKLSDLRGEPMMLTPSPITVDPFLLNGSYGTGASNSSSDPFAMHSLSGSLPGSNGLNEGPYQSQPAMRKISSGISPAPAFHMPLTSSASLGSFQMSSSPMAPNLPPRPMTNGQGPSNANGFNVIAPPPAPRRNGTTSQISALGLSMQQNTADPFSDNFFGGN